jgi:hypothetical protein
MAKQLKVFDFKPLAHHCVSLYSTRNLGFFNEEVIQIAYRMSFVLFGYQHLLK